MRESGFGIQGIPSGENEISCLLHYHIIFQQNALFRNNSPAVYLQSLHSNLRFVCISASNGPRVYACMSIWRLLREFCEKFFTGSSFLQILS